MSLGRLGIDLYANMASFTSDLGRAARVSEQNARKMERQWKQAGLVIAGAATAAAGAITGMVRAAARDADELAKVSQQIGITVERLSALKFAAGQSGVEFNNLRSSIARLSRTAADAATGVGKPVAAFQALGVSVRDAQGQMKSTDALLSEIASKFATYEDGIAKTALAQELFGRSGAALIPMLNQGAAGIQELTEQAARLGLVINTETAQASERLNDNVAALRLTFDGFKNQLLQEIVPGLAAFSQRMVESAESSNAMKSSATILSNTLKGMVVGFVFVAESIQLATTTMAGFLDIVVNVFRAIKNVALSQAQALGEALLAAVTLDPSGVRDAYAKAGEVVSEEIDRVIGTVRFATGEIGRQFVEGLGDVRGAVDNLFGDLPEDIQDVGDNARRVQAPVLEMARSVDAVADAAREAEKAMAAYEQIINGLLREFAPLEALQNEYQQSLLAVAQAVEKAGLSEDMAAQARELLTRRYRESVAAIESALSPSEELIASLDEEIRLLQMGNAERQVELAMRGATVGMTEQQVAALRNVVTARLADIEAITAANAATEEANRKQQQLVSTISESLADALLEGSKGFKNFARQMLDMTKRMVAQMIAEFLRLRIIGPLLGSMGGAGQAFAGSMGGIGGGGMGGLGGMGMMPGLAGIGGAVYGFQNAGSGGVSSLAAGAAYGGLAWTGATIGYGAMLGGAAGAATGAGIGATVGGAASGAAGAAAAIPIIGWVLAIAALVDMFSGGKLFGTKFRPEDIESTIGIGAEGGTAGATMTEVRNRSLFRGRRWRTTEIDPGDEAREAAVQFYENVAQAMQSAAEQMSADVIPVIDAQIRQITEYDRKGRETGTRIMVDVIGRTWEELSAEAAGMRIIGEAILAQVDSAIASGELASILAEPYRQTAEELMMFADFAVRAAADVRSGSALIADSFEANVYITEELARAGETLTDTYSRLLVSTRALRDGLELAGYEILNTDEEVVRFADALATAAGSADEASRLWASYVNAFVDPVERTAMAFDRARASMVESLAGIGLDPETTAAQFGEAFRAAMQSEISPESMVEWLRAAEAVAEFTRAGEPLRQMIAGMNAELGQLGAVDYGAMLANIVAQTRQNIQMAAAMGASESDLATIREYGIAQARALQAAQRAADREYARFIENIILSTNSADPGGYIAGMLEIERATEDAIRDANELAQAAGRQGASEADLNAIREHGIRQAQALVEAQRQADRQYARFIEDIVLSTNSADPGGYIVGMLQIERATEDAIRNANALAIAAGRQGASESDLAAIRENGIRQAEALVEAQRQADRQYARFIEDITLATNGADPGGYITSMLAIERATEDAIRNADDLARAAGRQGASESDLAAIREHGIRQTEALVEAQRRADQQYSRFIEDLIIATDGVDPTGYRAAMLSIERATQDAIRDANALAIAAGRQGASERELAVIHRWAASQARAAINQLRDTTQSLIEQLGYGRLSEIEAQIAALEGAQASVFDGTIGGFEAAGQAGEDTAARWLSAVQSIHGWLDSIMLSDLSTLTPEQRLSEAQAQFDALVRAALGGDAEAASQLPGAASALLQEGRGFWASGDAYTTLFNSVRDAMAQVAGMAIPGGSFGGSVGGSYGGGAASAVVNPELEALLAERDAMIAQQEAAQRVILAQQLAEHLAQLAEALGQPILEMAESMGVSMTQLAADLGIDLTEANADVVAQLAGLAAMLGIDLATLAADVGISLGDLADAQSLLNDALELAIVGLPQEHADELAPLLRAVENAASTDESEAALAALNAATAALPAEYRNQLAPFLEGVDPLLEEISAQLEQIDILSRVADLLEGVRVQLEPMDLLTEVAASLEGIRVQLEPIDLLESVSESLEGIRVQLDSIDLLTEVARLQITAIEATTAAITSLTLAVIPPMERVAAANDEHLPRVSGDTEAIRRMIGDQNRERGLATYATGTMHVPRTGLYNLHEGESVWPRAVTEFFSREGVPSGGGDSSRIEDRLARIEEAIIRGSGQVTDAVKSERMQSVDRVRYG